MHGAKDGETQSVDAFVSLWSADLLDLRSAVRSVDDLVAGYHVDVFDGHNAPELLFGPDLVAALREATQQPIEVHLNVTDPHFWVDRFADAGADIITVQTGPCPDVVEVLQHIAERSCRPGLGVELHEATSHALDLVEHTGRILLLGTEIGVKGVQQDPGTSRRVGELAAGRAESQRSFDIVVDGGIRSHTVPALAAAGADGIVPGSLVFGVDPRGALREIAALQVGMATDDLSPFWVGAQEHLPSTATP